MKINSYTPDLTEQEVERCWMTPMEVCDMASIGDISDPKIKKLLNTISDRKQIPYVKSGEARRDPRLYSLSSALMLRIMFDVTRDGRTYRYAEPIALAARSKMVECVSDFWDIGEYESEFVDDCLVFTGIKEDGTPRKVGWQEEKSINNMGLSFSVYHAGYLIYRMMQVYADMWSSKLAEEN